MTSANGVFPLGQNPIGVLIGQAGGPAEYLVGESTGFQAVFLPQLYFQNGQGWEPRRTGVGRSRLCDPQPLQPDRKLRHAHRGSSPGAVR